MNDCFGLGYSTALLRRSRAFQEYTLYSHIMVTKCVAVLGQPGFFRSE